MMHSSQKHRVSLQMKMSATLGENSACVAGIHLPSRPRATKPRCDWLHKKNGHRALLSGNGLQCQSPLGCCLSSQASTVVTAASVASRRPAVSFSLSRGGCKRPRYVALVVPFQQWRLFSYSLNVRTKRPPFSTNTHDADQETAQAVS